MAVNSPDKSTGKSMGVKLLQALRLICLSLLFGGSVASVYAAINLVRAGEAQGLTAVEAATNNSPIFIGFGWLSLVVAVLLVISEVSLLFLQKRSGKIVMVRVASSFLSFVFAAVFAVFLIGPMEGDLAVMKTNEAAHEHFKQLHQISRMVMTGTILFSLISLVIPAFGDEPNMRAQLEELILKESRRSQEAE